MRKRRNLNLENKPLAAKGLISYRYPSRYSGWIMIGATDLDDALREAARSTDNVSIDRMQVWDGQEYVTVQKDDDVAEFVRRYEKGNK